MAKANLDNYADMIAELTKLPYLVRWQNSRAVFAAFADLHSAETYAQTAALEFNDDEVAEVVSRHSGSVLYRFGRPVI